jgi:hypothetical protein
MGGEGIIMRKIHVGQYGGGTSIIDLNEDGSGTLKIRYRKMTDPTVTKQWVEKDFSEVSGGVAAIDARARTLADGTEEVTTYPDVSRGTLYLR